MATNIFLKLKNSFRNEVKVCLTFLKLIAEKQKEDKQNGFKS